MYLWEGASRQLDGSVYVAAGPCPLQGVCESWGRLGHRGGARREGIEEAEKVRKDKGWGRTGRRDIEEGVSQEGNGNKEG